MSLKGVECCVLLLLLSLLLIVTVILLHIQEVARGSRRTNGMDTHKSSDGDLGSSVLMLLTMLYVLLLPLLLPLLYLLLFVFVVL